MRSFDARDADFFLDLLPGPRDRDGLPESIRFWKTRIEETDPDETFRVGLIYGPSGCGKSSLVKAGLLPRLAKESVVSVLVEATADTTEVRLMRALQKQIPRLRETENCDLVETLADLRAGPELWFPMMAVKRTNDELAVITRTYDLILWSCNHTSRFPRNHRFVLGERIERNLYGLLEILIPARLRRATSSGFFWGFGFGSQGCALLVPRFAPPRADLGPPLRGFRFGQLKNRPGRSGRPQGSKALPGHCHPWLRHPAAAWRLEAATTV